MKDTDGVCIGADTPQAQARGDDLFWPNRRAWRVTLGIAVALWGLALLTWAQHGVDEMLVRQAAARDPLAPVVLLALVASAYGKSAMAAILLAGLVASFWSDGWRRHREIALLTLLSLGISGLGEAVLKKAVDRPRPAAAHPDLSFTAPESTTAAFPSGHSAMGVALALPFLVFARDRSAGRELVRLALSGLAGAVCASRVVLGAHYLSDVLGGVAMAVSGLPLAVLATNAILERQTPADMDRVARIETVVYAVLVFVLWRLS